MDDRQQIFTERDVLPFILGLIIGIVGDIALGVGTSGIGTGAALGVVMVIANREWVSCS